MNIRASLLAVLVLVIGLAGTVIIGIEKDYPLFTDLFGLLTPRYSLSAARIDSRIEIDARIATGLFELDLKPLQEVQKPGSLLIELPNDSMVLEAGIRVESKEYKASVKKLEMATPTIDSKLVLDSVQWTLVGSNLVLIEFDPGEKHFTLWLKISGFMAPTTSGLDSEKAILQFPRLIGFSATSKGKLQTESVLLDLSPEAIAQTAAISNPDFSAARSPEQISAGEGRSIGFARAMSATELTEGLKISIPLDKSITMVWLPVNSTTDSSAAESPVPESPVPESSVLVARFSMPSPRVVSHVSKVVPESYSEADLAKVDSAISGILAGASPIEVKLSRPESACDDAASLLDAWQWAAAKVDSLVVWVPGSTGVPCPGEQLSAILSPLTHELGRAGGKPEIVVLPHQGGVERIREFSPWFSSVTGLRSGNYGRYHVEFATFARESLPLGPEVVMAPEILHVLWEHSLANNLANNLASRPEILTSGKALTVARP